MNKRTTTHIRRWAVHLLSGILLFSNTAAATSATFNAAADTHLFETAAQFDSFSSAEGIETLSKYDTEKALLALLPENNLPETSQRSEVPVPNAQNGEVKEPKAEPGKAKSTDQKPYPVESALNESSSIQEQEAGIYPDDSDSMREPDSSDSTSESSESFNEALKNNQSESVDEVPESDQSGSANEAPESNQSGSANEAPESDQSGSANEVPENDQSGSASEAPESDQSESSDAISDQEPEIPDTPKLLSVHASAGNQILVKWKKVTHAAGYRIYFRTKDTSWKKYMDVDADSDSLEVTNLTCGTRYGFTVKAYAWNQNNQKVFSLCDKDGIWAVPRPAAPVLSKITCDTDSVTIQWKSVLLSDSYYIYRKTLNGEWKRIAIVNGKTTSYTDKALSYSAKYRYTVRSVQENVKGSYDTEGLEGAVKVHKLTLNSISISSSGKATVKWKADSAADGYLIYRKKGEGYYELAGTVSAEKTSFTDKNLNQKSYYKYTVSGYRTLNGKKIKGVTDTAGISPTLSYSGTYVRNVVKTYIGLTGAGRKMYSYTVGTGKNHIVITAAIHGWEDNWSRDGSALVKTAEKLIQHASERLSLLKRKNCSLIVVPMANPDGLLDGYTCNGPGRCTTYRYNASGQLVKGGVDLNRCFPYGFSSRYNSRNYTGSRKLMAREAVVLKKFVDSNKGSGTNFFIDAHGWYNQTITRVRGGGTVYRAFKTYFSGTRSASLGGMGYISSYAGSIGYQAALFEFPSVYSYSQFLNNHYDTKFINSVYYLVNSL